MHQARFENNRPADTRDFQNRYGRAHPLRRRSKNYRNVQHDGRHLIAEILSVVLQVLIPMRGDNVCATGQQLMPAHENLWAYLCVRTRLSPKECCDPREQCDAAILILAWFLFLNRVQALRSERKYFLSAALLVASSLMYEYLYR